ncbi:MAG: hypothetical protein HKN23_20130 [Verrucomicrobiales bacterium]|nr:hypothetical protein [Verrucomicrobiales bacterium]
MATHLIHLSDTHFGPEREFTVRGAPVLDRARRVVEEINALPFQPAAVIHTGDIANDPFDEAYRIAEEVFSDLNAPIYYTTGNHDDVPMMREHLTFHNGMNPLVPESENRHAYTIEIDGIALFILDGKVPPEEGPHGNLSETQISALTDFVENESGPFAVFNHFPALPIGSKWIDNNLPLKNGREFHEILKSAGADRFYGSFFGHLHRGLQIYHDNILYSAVSSPACQFTAGPNDEYCDFLPDVPICFNHITFANGITQVKEYTFPS